MYRSRENHVSRNNAPIYQGLRHHNNGCTSQTPHCNHRVAVPRATSNPALTKAPRPQSGEWPSPDGDAADASHQVGQQIRTRHQPPHNLRTIGPQCMHGWPKRRWPMPGNQHLATSGKATTNTVAIQTTHIPVTPNVKRHRQFHR